MRGKVAVVIPVYKTSIDEFEQLSLRTCFKVLKSHPIFFVKPSSLELSNYLSFLGGNEFLEKSFENHFFSDIQGYNRLMLSDDFYKEFLAYEYILIYQLDAIVFNDELLYWCDKGYDYIGAPWLYSYTLRKTLLSFFHYRLNVKQKAGNSPTKLQFYNRVGNGGFSLRNVEKFLEVCLKEKEKIDYYNQHSSNPFFNEDVFWSLEVNRKQKVLKIPGHKTAARFALERKPEMGLKLSNGKLPFGVHAWPKTLQLWKPYIEELSNTLKS